MKGRFITFEGIDGAGKTTQAAMLKKHLQANGHRVEVTHEPGGTDIGKAIRSVLLDPAHSNMDPTTELLLFEAARAQHVRERIRPTLGKGAIVICDRFVDSTSAYQGAGRNLPDEELARLHSIATGGLSPDLTILLDLSVQMAQARLYRQAPMTVPIIDSPAEDDPASSETQLVLHEKLADLPVDRIERQRPEFHERVRRAFLALAEKEGDRIKIVAGGPPRAQVAQEIEKLVNQFLDTQEPGPPS